MSTTDTAASAMLDGPSRDELDRLLHLVDHPSGDVIEDTIDILRTRTVLTVAEFRQIMNVGRTRAYAMIASGEVESIRIGTGDQGIRVLAQPLARLLGDACFSRYPGAALVLTRIGVVVATALRRQPFPPAWVGSYSENAPRGFDPRLDSKEAAVTSVGIVGAGTAGLHLGLQLVQAGIPVTIYTNRTAEQIGAGRLPNSVAHHALTIDREDRLGVNHWPVEEYGYDSHHHYFGLPDPIVFRGDFARRSRAVDYRIYTPSLMADFEDRGGRVEIRDVDVPDLEGLSERHDLLTVASGKFTLGQLFGQAEGRAPLPGPLRRLQVGLWKGIARNDPHGVSIAASPGHGDLLEIPIFSFAGHVTALLFENVPGGELEKLVDVKHDDDPAAFRRMVLDVLRVHYPKTFERVNEAEFELTDPNDLLQGQFTPTLRNDFAQLDNGRYVLAVGDIHATLDPIVGQGANSASYSAQVVGDTVLEDQTFDLRFMKKVADRRRNRVEAAFDWSNLMAGPPPGHLLQLVGAMAQDQELPNEFTWNFNQPDRQWDILATPERTAAAIARSAAKKAAPKGEPINA